MKQFFSRLWEQMNVPKNERLLIILIPCLTLLAILSIIAPTVIYLTQPDDAEIVEDAESAGRSNAEQTEYVQIENIDEVVEVVDSTELSQSEIKPSAEPIDPLEPEYLVTPEDAQNGEVVIEDAPVYDENGHQKYLYSFNVGPGGSLLYNGSGRESGVVPVDENNDGVPDYGLKWVSVEPQYDEFSSQTQSAATGYYISVALFNADNTPVSTYDITAIPVTETITSLVGWQTVDGKQYYYDSFGRMATGLKNIDGKLYYFNQSGIAASSLGIDISFYNDSINWPAVKAQGIDFVIIRVGGRGWQTGVLYDDSCFIQNLSGAKNAGIKVGVYFYSTAVDAIEAVQEASIVLDRLNGTPLELPIYIDVEQSGSYPRGRSDTLNKGQRSEIINAFCRTVMNSGYRAGVYSGAHFLTHNLEFSTISRYSIWIANYTRYNRLPNFSERYDLWQFTDRGIVNGIPNVVDMNAVFN